MEKDNIEIKKRGGEAGAMHSERGNKMKVTRNVIIKISCVEVQKEKLRCSLTQRPLQIRKYSIPFPSLFMLLMMFDLLKNLCW